MAETPHTGFRLPEETVEQLDALAHKESPQKPSRTHTLVRIIAQAYEAAGSPKKAKKGKAKA